MSVVAGRAARYSSVPVTSLDALFDALSALRDAGDPLDRRHDARWRTIDAYLRATFPAEGAEADEARQETLIAIGRAVGQMEAAVPLQAAKWIATIHRRKVVDGVRARRRDPARSGLDREGDASLVDRLEADDRPSVGPDAIARVVAALEDEIDAHLLEVERSAVKRQLHRTQARAAVHRLLLEADFDEIVRALDAGEALGRDRVYKWVERGRPVVLAALERWARRAGEGSTEAGIADAIREIVEARRADAGQPRPSRRKGAPP